MNIGIVTTWFERGASYVSKQYMELLQNDNKVFIYARGGEEYAKGDSNWNQSNVTWGKKSIFQMRAMPIIKSDFKKWIKGNKIEVLLFNEQQWWPPVIWAKELGIIVGSYVDYYTKETVPFFEIFDFLICNTKRHQSVFDWHKQNFYIPWGTDVDLFVPDKKRDCDKDKIVFFNSSGYSPDRKGVYPLLKSFYKTKGDNKKLILHSQIDLEDYYSDLKKIIHEMKQSGVLEVISETVSAPGLYHYADVYCYLSKLDGIGLTLPEAISCGLQAIIPDNPPMNEFVQEGVNGRLTKIEKLYCREDAYYWPQCDVDIDDLTVILQDYIDKQDSIQKMKNISREYALKNLDWKKHQNDMNTCFNTVVHYQLNDQLVKKIYNYESKQVTFREIILYPYKVLYNIKRIYFK